MEARTQRVVVGVTPDEVHAQPRGPRQVGQWIHRRAALWRLLGRSLAGVTFGTAVFTAVLGVTGELVGAAALLPLVVGLAVCSVLADQAGKHLAETVQHGLVVPVRVRLLHHLDELELDFVTDAKQPAWHQHFPPAGEHAARFVLSYELDGREYLAVDAVEPGDRIAALAIEGRTTPAVFVRRERPDRPVLVTEQALYAPPH